MRRDGGAAPVAGQLVRLAGEGGVSLEATTGDNGLFRLVGIPAGGPYEWWQGDFTGDQIVDGLDIQAILATGLWATQQPYAPAPPSPSAVDPGTSSSTSSSITPSIRPLNALNW